MKKTILIFAMVIFVVTNIFAKKVDEATAKKVAFSFMTKRSSTKEFSKIKDLQLVHTGKNSKSMAMYYIYNVTKKGFVIVSGDDAVIPILAYSDEGEFTLNNIAPATKEWLEGYTEQINYIITENIRSTTEIKSEWTSYINGKIPASNTRASVSALIQTTWNQSPYYNNLCPGGSLTGCVATAMAQIMKYWNSPTQGVGSHSYNCPNYGLLSVNFGTTTYNWNSMPNSLTSSSTSEQKLAVATLMYHCGVSVDMQYSPSGSGAPTEAVVTALKNHFNYSPTAEYVSKSNNYTNSEWISLLKNELNANRPIQYRGTASGATGGHSFICDGYDNINRFHFNWGWGGNADGYFAIGSLNPQGYDFNSNNSAIIGIKPISINGSGIINANCSAVYSIDVSGSGTNTWTLTNGWKFSNGSSTISGVNLTSVTVIAAVTGSTTLTVSGGNLSFPITKSISAQFQPLVWAYNYPSLCMDYWDMTWSINPVPCATSYAWSYVPLMSPSGGITLSPNGTSCAISPVKVGTYKIVVKAYYGSTAGNQTVGTIRVYTSSDPKCLLWKTIASDNTERSTDNLKISTEIYPNPASQSVNIKFETSEDESYNINIYDMMGKQVYSSNEFFTEGNHEVAVDVKDLPNGIYYIIAGNNENRTSKKLIVTH